jgi:hypothetical protein
MPNWIPARVSHPTVAPTHLLSQHDVEFPTRALSQLHISRPRTHLATGLASETNMAGTSNDKSENNKDLEAQKASPVTSSTGLRRGGGRGGLSASKWAI